jgi:hypothetical protein
MAFQIDRNEPEHFGAVLAKFGTKEIDFWCDFGAPYYTQLFLGVASDLTGLFRDDEDPQNRKARQT